MVSEMHLFENSSLPDEKKKKLMEKYPLLTEEDFNEDNQRKLLIHLQQKLGKTKEEMRQIIKDI